jgi:hypothetical protein
MNRFTGRHSSHLLRTVLLSAAGFAAAMVLFLYGLGNAGASSSKQQMESLTAAINRDVIHCYATEGVYPESLDWIEKHYGLTYDSSRFYVDYQPVAKNIMPEITVIDLKGGAS